MDFQEKVKEIVSEMGEEYTVHNVQDWIVDIRKSGEKWAYMRSASNGRIELHVDQITLESDRSWFYKPYNGHQPSITVGKKRPSPAIAKDIHRRFTAGCDAWIDAANRWKKEMDGSQQTTDAYIEKVKELAVRPNMRDDRTVRTFDSKWEVRICGSGADNERTIDAKIDGLTLAQFKQVLELLDR